MAFSPMLASDTIGSGILLYFLIPLGLGGLGFVTIVVNRSFGNGRWWGLLLGLIPMLVGGLVLLACLLTSGGVPPFFYVAAIVPLVSGIWSIRVWKQPKRA